MEDTKIIDWMLEGRVVHSPIKTLLNCVKALELLKIPTDDIQRSLAIDYLKQEMHDAIMKISYELSKHSQSKQAPPRKQ
jgi:hypothetical protein